MAVRHAEILESLRGGVVQRLIEIRAGIDPAYAHIPEETIARQFDVVLGKMVGYLTSGDAEQYRRFASRWSALRVGEGVSPESLIHAVVAIGDVVVRIAREQLAPGPEQADFVRAVTRMTFLAARLMVENLGDELARRQQQLASLGGGAR